MVAFFMFADAMKHFYERLRRGICICLSRAELLLRPGLSEDICPPLDGYSIVSPVSMVRVGGTHASQRVHILVYGRIDPPHPGVTVQVTFQGHQLDIDAVASGQNRSVRAVTDRAGEFVVDENFVCGPQVKFITSVSSLPETEAPTVISSLRLEKEARCCNKKCGEEKKKEPLPTAIITIDFESHCQKSVTYWFENPYKKGTISQKTEISYCPTESSALYLKPCPHKEHRSNIIDIFTTTKEHPVPRYQRVHTANMDEEFTRIAIFEPEATLKSALILV
ncbi:MAG: hypothetical protein D3910_09430 [Candidatus Electrothrix sp. ATG2]|nr:hypothetical protein [Candidatus Electrothrix sp. ATG2]